MFKLILIDLSGTLHVENSPTTGAITALKRYCYVACKDPFILLFEKHAFRLEAANLKVIKL